MFGPLERWFSYSGRRRLLDRDLDTMRGHIIGHVLEVGAGSVGRRGRFIPPSENVLTWTYVDLHSGKRPTVAADVQALPLQDRSFDTVVCLEVLEYVRDPHRAFLEMARVLRTGGNLLVSTPFLHRFDTDHDYWRFSKHALRYLASTAGLETKQVLQQGHALASMGAILKNLVAGVRHTWARRLLGLTIWLPVTVLNGMDAPLQGRPRISRTFSTGYLVRAIRIS